jgi:hypothetical protein
MRLATQVLNYADLASSLSNIEQEERKEIEYEWIWKEV